MEAFSESDFEQKLFQLKDTHDSISSLSSWCLTRDEHHEKIVSVWLNVMKRVKTEHRVLMFYLANDIVQYSKKKSLPFLDSFAPVLQKATTMVRDDSIRNKILRLFKIWDERNIYDESYLVDLSNLLTRGPKSANRIDVDDFQPSILYSRLRSCQALEEDTDAKMKILVESHISLTDVDKMRTSIKDRQASEDVVHEVDEGIKKITAFISSLEAEIKERIGLIDLLEIGEQFYEKEMGEAKIVVNAYKCFTNRVKTVKRKLEEKVENLPSPVPSPQADAPSPSPEPEKISGGDLSFDFTPGGSFMDGSLLVDEHLAKQFEEFSSKRVDTTSDISMNSSNDSFNQIPYFPTQLPLTNPPPPPPPPVPPSLPPDKIDFPVESLPPVVDAVSSTTQNSFFEIPPTTSPSLSLNPSTVPEPLVPHVQRPDSFLSSHFSDEASTTDSVATEGNKIEVISSGTKPLSLSSLLESMVPSSVISSLPPPPALPTELQMGDSSQAWNDDILPDWESPESPPHYEKEAFPSVCEVPIISQDVDMRCHDIDHRNLISLTGGSETSKWSQSSVPRSNDNVDNVDMEMSDEEEKRNENDSGYSETAPKVPSITLNGVISKKPKLVRNGQSDNHQKTSEFRPIETVGYSPVKSIPSVQKFDGIQPLLKPLTPVKPPNDTSFNQMSLPMTPEVLPTHDFFIGGSNSPTNQTALQNPSSPSQYPQSGSKMYQLPPPPPPPPMPTQFLSDSKDLYWRNSTNFNLPPPHQYEPRSLPPPPPPPPHFANVSQSQFIHRQNGPPNNSAMNGSMNGPVRFRPGFRSYRPRFNRY